MSIQSVKLSLKEKLGYATGDFASNLFWQPFTVFLLYYYTDIFGISAAAIGTMFLVTRIWDTFFDPVIGIIADRTNTKWGKFRPFILWMAIPFGVIGAITYLAPEFNQSGKLLFAYITYTIMMMIYSAINVPYSALLGVISPDPHERESVSSYKFVFAFLAGIIVQAATLPLVDHLGKGDNKVVQVELKNNQLIINEKKNGTARIVIKARDEKGNEKQTQFFVKTYKKGAIPPQAISTLSFDTLYRNFNTRTYPLSQFFSNPDNKPLKYEVKTDNKKAVKVSIENNQLILKEVGPGIATITISASNDYGTAQTSFTVAVTEKNNYFPERVRHMEDIVLQKGTKADTIPLNNLFTDRNNDSLNYFALSNNLQIAGVTIDKNKLIIKEVNEGLCNVVLYCYDGKGGMATDTFNVTIRNIANNAPFVINPPANQNLTAGFHQIIVPLNNVFNDIDGDKLTYSITTINEAKGYFSTMSIFAVVAILMFFITFFSTKERVQPIAEKSSSVKDDLKDLLKNRPWLVLFALSIFMQIYVAIRQSSIIYYFKYYVGNTQLASLYLVLGTLASLAGSFLIQFIAKKFGKKMSFITLIVFGSLLTILTYWVKPDQYIPMFGLQVVLQFFTGPLSPLLWAMYTDSADYSEWRTGRRATGLILSASVFSLKFGWAIGSAITGWLLAYFGFQANIIQNAEAQEGIRLLISFIPSISLILAGLMMLFYNLNEKTLAVMTTDLAKRREEKNV
jgi:Na+/melibiose symporter-like transporter